MIKFRICITCKENKRLCSDNFPKQKRNSENFNPQCKVCRNEYVRNWEKEHPLQAHQKERKKLAEHKRKAKNPERFIAKKKAYTYKVTEKEILALPKSCCICRVKHDLCVDHNHKTGKIRSTLCRKCNLGLGHFDDDLEKLQSAIKYLSKF